MTNCTNCGGSLPANSSICRYCNTRNEIDLHNVHEYTKQEPNETRICPHCNIPLTTINIKTDEVFYIEQCELCKGMFFDPNELEALLEASVSNVFNINYERIDNINKELYAEQKVKYINCPICKKKMNRKNFATCSGVIADVCRDHGIWLDCGELKHLLEWKKAGGHLLHEQNRIKTKSSEKHNIEPHFGAINSDKTELTLFNININNSDVLKILCILIPPIGVYTKDGIGFQLFLSIMLTFMGWFPGLMHFIWIADRSGKKSPKNNILNELFRD